MNDPFESLDPSKLYVYPYLPALRQLLPKTSGRPGVTYLQCALVNQRKAQDQGWGGVVGAQLYTLIDEKTEKRLDMVLLCKGKPIRGLDPNSGERMCYVDTKVEEELGWVIDARAAKEMAKPTAPAAKKTPTSQAGASAGAGA